MRPQDSSPDPGQSSRTGHTSHRPMSIVTSRLRTATWYAPRRRAGPGARGSSAVEQLADHLAALADQPVEPEELAEPLGRREPDHQHAVGDLDATEPAAEDRPGERGTVRARRGPKPRATPPINSPTAHEMRTMTSVASDPAGRTASPTRSSSRSRRAVEPEEDQVGNGLGHAQHPGGDDAHHDDDRVDRVRVEEPPDEEAPEARYLARMRDRLPDLAERRRRRRAGQPRPCLAFGSRTTRKIGMANTRNSTAGEHGSGRRPGRRGSEQEGDRQGSRSTRSPCRSRQVSRGTPGG